MDRAPHDASVNDSSQVERVRMRCRLRIVEFFLGSRRTASLGARSKVFNEDTASRQSTRISALSCRVPHPDGRFRALLREHAVHEGYSKEAIDAVSRFSR